MKRIKHLIEYAIVRLVEGFFFLWPRHLALGFGERLGSFFGFLLASRTKLALQNVKSAFPEKSDDECARIVGQMWKNLGRTAVEFIRSSDMAEAGFDSYFTIHGRDVMDRLKKLNKGVVLVTMHFGNWEMLAVGTCRRFGGSAIARPMKNPFVEGWIQRKRANAGTSTFLHRQAVKASLKLLREKQIVGILADHNLYQGGIFVDFFGRPAATTTLPALLHDRTGAPVIIAYCLSENGKFRLVYEESLELPSIQDAEERIAAHTKKISQELERVIRAHPESWFWIHNRWKRQPAA